MTQGLASRILALSRLGHHKFNVFAIHGYVQIFRKYVSNMFRLHVYELTFMSRGGVLTFVSVTPLDVFNEELGYFPDRFVTTEPVISSQNLISSLP